MAAQTLNIRCNSLSSNSPNVAGINESQSSLLDVYLTALVCTKITIYLSLSSWQWMFNSPFRGPINIHP